VDISAAAGPSGGFKLTVGDTGIGMSKEDSRGQALNYSVKLTTAVAALEGAGLGCLPVQLTNCTAARSSRSKALRGREQNVLSIFRRIACDGTGKRERAKVRKAGALSNRILTTVVSGDSRVLVVA